MTGWRSRLAVGILAAAMAVPSSARAEMWEDAGWGALSVLTNVGYMPAKLVYAVLGGITGGLAWGLTAGDTEVAERIWGPALGGDYVVTPRMVRGDEPITFAAFDDGSASGGSSEPSADEDRISEERLSGS